MAVGLGALIITMIFLAFIVLAILAFEVWMFVDALQNPQLTPGQKFAWLVGMLLIHPFVAIVYFLVARRSLPPRD